MNWYWMNSKMHEKIEMQISEYSILVAWKMREDYIIYVYVDTHVYNHTSHNDV